MKHNKWAVISLGCLVACAIPGGLGMMLGVLVQVALAGVCFAKWVIEEDKYQRAMYEKFLEDLKKKGLTKPLPHAIIKIQKRK